MKQISKIELIAQKLKELEVGQSFSKKQYIISLYGKYEFFLSRSFDVLLIHAKKRLEPNKFRTINRQITRIA